MDCLAPAISAYSEFLHKTRGRDVIFLDIYGERVCPKQSGRPCSIWCGPCSANVYNTETLLAFEFRTPSRSASTRVMPPDEATRPCFPSTACLIQEPALLCISSIKGSAFEFWATFGQSRWPRALVMQRCPADAHLQDANKSLRRNILWTSLVLVRALRNRLAFEFWRGLELAGRRLRPRRRAFRGAERRPQVRRSSAPARQTCVEWGTGIPMRNRLELMSMQKSAPRSNSGACFADWHGP